MDEQYVLVSTPERSFAKGVTWEVSGLVTVAVVALLVTGNLLAALAIGAAVFPVRVGMYFLHERLWKHFKWGHRYVERE